MSGVWKFLFNGKLEEPIYKFRRIKVSRKQGEPEPIETKPETETVPAELKFGVVMFLSRTLGIVLLLSVAGVLGLLFTDRDVPEFLTLTISAIIGYFGGAITAYVGLQKLNERKVP